MQRSRCSHTRDPKNPAESLDPMATSSIRKPRALDNISCQSISRICTGKPQRSGVEARKSILAGWRMSASRLGDLHSQEVTLKVGTTASLKRITVILSDIVLLL